MLRRETELKRDKDTTDIADEKIVDWKLIYLKTYWKTDRKVK